MKRSIFVIASIVIVLLFVFLKLQIGDYFSVPEDALKNYKANDMSYKLLIEKVWLNDEPVVFYISKSDDFCKAEYRRKNIFGEIKYKVVKVGALPPIKNIRADSIIPNQMAAIKHSNSSDPNRILFGVTRYSKANTIKINDKSPKFKEFELNGEKYTLWYAVGTNDLEFDKVKITSE